MAFPTASCKHQNGFAYLWFLLMVAVMSIGMGVAAELWQTLANREKEKELLFIGHQFRMALAAYRDSDVGDGSLPLKLVDLLQDPRAEDEPMHYLRKIYVDPMTNSTNWGLVLNEDEEITGVYSLSTGIPTKQAGFSKDDRLFAGKQSYSDWKFIVRPEKGEEDNDDVK